MGNLNEMKTILWLVVASLGLVTPSAFAFVSGSTGVDGAFNPTLNTELQLPPSGVFNFTTVNIPAGVTVGFKKNITNTPVVVLASGNVTIAGTIDLRGTASANTGSAGDGNVGDDGLPGTGGPGGYDGGLGGAASLGLGGTGRGPGGGEAGLPGPKPNCSFSGIIYGGGGGGFGAGGADSTGLCNAGDATKGGPVYGTSALLPLVGGSGGGGSPGGANFLGSGGGGGGGAVLIASSGAVSISGTILANGGPSGSTGGSGSGSTGGGGSGGAIRIVATTITGNGTVSAAGGGAGTRTEGGARRGGSGGVGRIRMEAETFTRTAASNPVHSFATPAPLFVAGLPTLRIASVAGVAAPAAPTGNADITLPATTINPVGVIFETTDVPVGNTVTLTVKPASGLSVSAISPALTGTTTLATASVQVNLPSGPSTLEATTTFTIVALLGEQLGNQFANGERVEKIEVAAGMTGPSTVTLITVSGKRYPMPGPIPAIPAAG